MNNKHLEELIIEFIEENEGNISVSNKTLSETKTFLNLIKYYINENKYQPIVTEEIVSSYIEITPERTLDNINTKVLTHFTLEGVNLDNKSFKILLKPIKKILKG